jgi:hypothetical protein
MSRPNPRFNRNETRNPQNDGKKGSSKCLGFSNTEEKLLFLENVVARRSASATWKQLAKHCVSAPSGWIDEEAIDERDSVRCKFISRQGRFKYQSFLLVPAILVLNVAPPTCSNQIGPLLPSGHSRLLWVWVVHSAARSERRAQSRGALGCDPTSRSHPGTNCIRKVLPNHRTLRNRTGIRPLVRHSRLTRFAFSPIDYRIWSTAVLNISTRLIGIVLHSARSPTDVRMVQLGGAPCSSGTLTGCHARGAPQPVSQA